MYAVASMSTENLKEFADITDASKKEYCDKHGYLFFPCKEDTFTLVTEPYTPYMNFNKMYVCLDIFKKHPEIEWLLFSECDAMITNSDIKMEDRIDNDYHFIIASDRLNLNAGNFLIRNSKQGRAYFEMILSHKDEPEYRDHRWTEQWVIINTIEENLDIVKIVPQWQMNSYQTELYDYCDTSKDLFGNRGTWEDGDWIIHWPGLYDHTRIPAARRMAERRK